MDLDLEFAYVTHQDSCKNPFSPEQYCRRKRGHDGFHASGFGRGRVEWTDDFYYSKENDEQV